jgi:hypothetical protein
MSELSETYTIQRSEGACLFHVFSKLMVQAMFQYFTPSSNVNVALYKSNRCNDFLDFDIFSTKDISRLSSDECSQGGYDRILQFLYVYYSVYLPEKIQAPDPLSLRTTRFLLDRALPIIFINIREHRIPDFFTGVQRDHVARMIHTLDEVMPNRLLNVFEVIWTDQYDLVNELINQVLHKGFYLGLGLKYVGDPTGSGHAVQIVAKRKHKVVLKNSWGGERLDEMDLEGLVFFAEFPDDGWRATKIFVVLPIKNILQGLVAGNDIGVLIESVKEMPPHPRGAIRELSRAPNNRYYTGDVVQMADGEKAVVYNVADDIAIVHKSYEQIKTPVSRLKRTQDKEFAAATLVKMQRLYSSLLGTYAEKCLKVRKKLELNEKIQHAEKLLSSATDPEQILKYENEISEKKSELGEEKPFTKEEFEDLTHDVQKMDGARRLREHLLHEIDVALTELNLPKMGGKKKYQKDDKSFITTRRTPPLFC